MKTMLKNLAALIVLIIVTEESNAQVKPIEFEQLPKTAQTFVQTHYKETNISYVTIESEFLNSIEYEVRFDDGKKIEFDAKGSWKELDGNKKSIPTKVVPISILSHVKKSFPNNEIVQIKKSGRIIEIELSNGLDLEFDKKGRFLRIDD